MKHFHLILIDSPDDILEGYPDASRTFCEWSGFVAEHDDFNTHYLLTYLITAKEKMILHHRLFFYLLSGIFIKIQDVNESNHSHSHNLFCMSSAKKDLMSDFFEAVYTEIQKKVLQNL